MKLSEKTINKIKYSHILSKTVDLIATMKMNFFKYKHSSYDIVIDDLLEMLSNKKELTHNIHLELCKAKKIIILQKQDLSNKRRLDNINKNLDKPINFMKNIEIPSISNIPTDFIDDIIEYDIEEEYIQTSSKRYCILFKN